MNYFTALIYGLIQGLSEFLPVSSSGHLALMPYIFSFKDPGVVFDLSLHLGTAGAVVLYFRTKIFEMCTVLGPGLLNFKLQDEKRVFFRNFVVATLVSVLFILLLKPFSSVGRNPWVIMVNQALFGIILWRADYVQRKKNKSSNEQFFSMKERWKEVIIIGAAQALAIFPGVSRSGITLTAAFMLGLDRVQASSFSFLLSLPIIIAGVLVEIPEIIDASKTGQFDIGILFVGVVTSFLIGLITIHFFLKLISNIQLVWFTGYRVLLALVLFYFLMN